MKKISTIRESKSGGEFFRDPLLPLLPACPAGGAVSTAARRHCASQLAAAAADRSRSSIRSGRGLQLPVGMKS